MKPALKVIYDDFYSRIHSHCRDGRTIEIGAGEYHSPRAIATNLRPAPWLDCVMDAQHPCFASASNLIMIDVLHHIRHPSAFVYSASRILERGGRIIMIEPAITWGSMWFYHLFHPEPVLMRDNPLDNHTCENQAIPTRLCRDHDWLWDGAGLRITYLEWFSFLAYPLSGGYRRWSLLSPRVARWLLRFEEWIPFKSLFAFRLLMVLEKET